MNDAPKVNDDAVACLAKWLAAAKRGEVQCVGIVASGDPLTFAADLAGQGGLEYPMNFGADVLKGKIQAWFARQQQSASPIMPARSPLLIPH